MAMVNQERYLPVKTNSISPSTADEHLDKPRVPNVKPQFEIGDIVWAQARGLPSWPGKVVDASEVGKGRPDDGKVTPGGGGHLGVFWVGMCHPGLQIGTPF